MTFTDLYNEEEGKRIARKIGFLHSEEEPDTDWNYYQVWTFPAPWIRNMTFRERLRWNLGPRQLRWIVTLVTEHNDLRDEYKRWWRNRPRVVRF